MLLQSYVNAQQQQIAILETSLADMARGFSQREQALRGQISALTQQIGRLISEKVSRTAADVGGARHISRVGQYVPSND